METNEHIPPSLHIIQQLKKQEKLIQLYYCTGRPIFNLIRDRKHVFIGENNKVRGFYY